MIFKNNSDSPFKSMMVFGEFKALINILIVFCLITGCASSGNRAPVSSRQQPPSIKLDHHIVAPGETLYSIAWRYGLDYKGLARANNIGADFSIYPNQIIRLDDSPVKLSKLPETIKAPQNKKPRNAGVGLSSHSANNSDKKNPIPRTTGNNISPQKTRSEKKSSPTSTPSPFYKTNQKIYWRWPAAGRVLTNFYSKQSLKKGIDIAGKKGDAVTAAASGQVVYAGSGLRGYGKLVIIKHSETYLSAYAHNQRLRVQEGDIVKTGQRIADIGTSGTGTNGKPKLHFQIRRDGKPIDPLPLLPKRKV